MFAPGPHQVTSWLTCQLRRDQRLAKSVVVDLLLAAATLPEGLNARLIKGPLHMRYRLGILHARAHRVTRRLHAAAQIGYWVCKLTAQCSRPVAKELRHMVFVCPCATMGLAPIDGW
jgi:hypothetical protein